MSYDPYALAVPAPPFTLSSADFTDGGPLPRSAYATDAGPGTSPALSWSGLPEGTRTLAVSAFDADAPIPGGLWHWFVVDLPANSGALPGGTGVAGHLPVGAVALPNDLGQAGYSGAQPPPGTGTHRLFIAATALDVDHLDIPDDASLAMVNILLMPHALGRAVLVATSQAPTA